MYLYCVSGVRYDKLSVCWRLTHCNVFTKFILLRPSEATDRFDSLLFKEYKTTLTLELLNDVLCCLETSILAEQVWSRMNVKIKANIWHGSS